MAVDPFVDGIVVALTGMHIPRANAAAIRAAVEQPNAALVKALSDLQDEIIQVATSVGSKVDGKWSKAYIDAMSTFASGDGADAVKNLKDTAAAMADFGHESAYQVDYMNRMIIAQVVQFLVEWAITLILAIFNPIEALIEQTFLRALYRAILRSIILRVIALIAEHEALNIGLSAAMDLLVRWSLSLDGQHTSHSGDFIKQAVGFGAVQGALSPFVPFLGGAFAKAIGSGIGRNTFKDLFDNISHDLKPPPVKPPAKDVTKDLSDNVVTVGGHDITKDSTDHFGGPSPGGPVRSVTDEGPHGPGPGVGAGPVGSGPVGSGPWSSAFAHDFADVTGKFVDSTAFGDINGAARKAFRTDIGNLFARDLHGLDSGAARSLGENWADSFLNNFGKKDLAKQLDTTLSGLPTGFDGFRKALSTGVADTLGTDWGRKFALHSGFSVVQAAHQNISEGFYNLFTTGNFTTSFATGLAGAAGGRVGHALHINAHALGSGIKGSAVSLKNLAFGGPVAPQHLNSGTPEVFTKAPPASSPTPVPTVGHTGTNDVVTTSHITSDTGAPHSGELPPPVRTDAGVGTNTGAGPVRVSTTDTSGFHQPPPATVLVSGGDSAPDSAPHLQQQPAKAPDPVPPPLDPGRRSELVHGVNTELRALGRTDIQAGPDDVMQHYEQLPPYRFNAPLKTQAFHIAGQLANNGEPLRLPGGDPTATGSDGTVQNHPAVTQEPAPGPSHPVQDTQQHEQPLNTGNETPPPLIGGRPQTVAQDQGTAQAQGSARSQSDTQLQNTPPRQTIPPPQGTQRGPATSGQPQNTRPTVTEQPEPVPAHTQEQPQPLPTEQQLVHPPAHGEPEPQPPLAQPPHDQRDAWTQQLDQRATGDGPNMGKGKAPEGTPDSRLGAWDNYVEKYNAHQQALGTPLPPGTTSRTADELDIAQGHLARWGLGDPAALVGDYRARFDVPPPPPLPKPQVTEGLPPQPPTTDRPQVPKTGAVEPPTPRPTEQQGDTAPTPRQDQADPNPTGQDPEQPQPKVTEQQQTTDAGPGPKPVTDGEPKPEPKIVTESDPKTVTEGEQKSEPKTDPTTDPKTEPVTQQKPDPKPKTEPDPVTEPKPKTKPDPVTGQKPTTEPEPKTEPPEKPLPFRIGDRLLLGGMDVVEEFGSGNQGLEHIKQVVIREAGQKIWDRDAEKISALFSDNGLRPKVPGMLRGGRPITHVVGLGFGRALAIDFRLKGAPDSGLHFKEDIKKYEFEHSSDPTNTVSDLHDGRRTYLGGVQGNIAHPKASDTAALLGAREHQWAVTNQRADRQISGGQTTEPGSRFTGHVQATITHRLSGDGAQPNPANSHPVNYKTTVVVPTRDVLDQSEIDEARDTLGPLPGSSTLRPPTPQVGSDGPPRVRQTHALSGSDVVTNFRLFPDDTPARDNTAPTADGATAHTPRPQQQTGSGPQHRPAPQDQTAPQDTTGPSVRGPQWQSISSFLTSRPMQDAFTKAYGKKANQVLSETNGWLTVELIQANLHGMTNKQPLVHELASVPGGRLEVHAFVEPLGTPSATRPPGSDGNPLAGPLPDRMLRPTGETGETEFHYGTETDTSEVRQDVVTWSGQLPVPGRFRGQGGTSTGEVDGGLDGTATFGHTRNEAQSRQYRFRNTLKNPAPGQGWHGQVRLRLVMHAPGSVSPTRPNVPFKGAVHETRGRFDVLMEKSQTTPPTSYQDQKVWAPPQRIWSGGPPAERNSVARGPWWRPGVNHRTIVRGADGEAPRPAYQPAPPQIQRGDQAPPVPLRGLGSMDRVTNLDLSGFHGMLDSMGHRAFGGGWKNVRTGVSSWYHLNRVRGALPAMTQHSPLTRTQLSGHGSDTKTSFTADIEELTFRRVINPLSSPSTEVTHGAASTTTTSRQLSEQAALGGRGGNVAGGTVLGEAIGGINHTSRDGDRQRNQERIVVATKFDQPMAIFDGWVRLDGTMTGTKATVHESGLFPVEIAIPLTELQGSRDHHADLPPTFNRDHPAGFVQEPRPKPAPGPVETRAGPSTTGTAPPRTLQGSQTTEAGPSNRPNTVADPKLATDPNAYEMQAVGTAHDAAPDSRPVLTDAKDGNAPPRPVEPPRPQLTWSPPEVKENPPQPPAHAQEGSWHPSDMLVGVDPASGLVEAIRQDLTPALGNGIDRAMSGIADQFGPHVLPARLTHESGREWTHDVPVTGGKIVVKVRPVREPGAQYVGTSKKFETDISGEGQSSKAHIHDNVLRSVEGGRLQVPFPHGSVTVQVTHSSSIRPREAATAVDRGASQLTDASGEGTTGETEERIPLRVKTVEPHDLFRQPIKFEISYEQHLGANLLKGIPEHPQPVRLNGVFSYPQHTPAAVAGTDAAHQTGPANQGSAPQHPRIDVDQVVLKVRPHITPAPRGQQQAQAGPHVQQQAQAGPGGQDRTPGEDAVAAHILTRMTPEGTAVFGDKWPKVRAELAPHVRTMAIQRGLGQKSRGATQTIDLKSVSGGKVVLSAHVDTMSAADSNATSEFYTGGQQFQTSGVSYTRANNWHGYVQVQGDVLPSGDAVNLSLLGRVDGGFGKETLNTRTENSATGLLFRKKAPSLTHVGTATVQAEMSKPAGPLGLGSARTTRTGTAQVDFITRKSAPDPQEHAQWAPRPGIVQNGNAADPQPHQRGLTPDSMVRKITDGDNFRSETLRHLGGQLGNRRVSRLGTRLTNSLTDTRLERNLPAMTRGDEVELFRLGSLRITGRADIHALDYRTIEHEGGNANVLNEVNQIRFNQPTKSREGGLRFLLGPHWKLPAFQGSLLAGGGVNGRQRFGTAFTQAAKVSANAKFARPYAVFDGQASILLTVTDGGTTRQLPPIDVHGRVLIPKSEVHPVEAPQTPTQTQDPNHGQAQDPNHGQAQDPNHGQAQDPATQQRQDLPAPTKQVATEQQSEPTQPDQPKQNATAPKEQEPAQQHSGPSQQDQPRQDPAAPTHQDPAQQHSEPPQPDQPKQNATAPAPKQQEPAVRQGAHVPPGEPRRPARETPPEDALEEFNRLLGRQLLDHNFGQAVAPKRVKDEELYPNDRTVRPNPLRTLLHEIKAPKLTSNKDAVWLYAVNDGGEVVLGSEHVTGVLLPEEFQQLITGLRHAEPDLTAEQLTARLDGLGHTGLAVKFAPDGTTVPGLARIAGEFRWNEHLGSWTVNDKSGRYMSGKVRPGLDPRDAARWLSNVAQIFHARLGVPVLPDQLKTTDQAPPAPPAPKPEPTVKPAPDPVTAPDLHQPTEQNTQHQGPVPPDQPKTTGATDAPQDPAPTAAATEPVTQPITRQPEPPQQPNTTEPTRPTEPAGPKQPTQPAQPTEPKQQTDPAHPTQPTQPAQNRPHAAPAPTPSTSTAAPPKPVGVSEEIRFQLAVLGNTGSGVGFVHQIHADLLTSGHGSGAVVQPVNGQGPSGAPLLVVNHGGDIVWFDPDTGTLVEPPENGGTLGALVLDPAGRAPGSDDPYPGLRGRLDETLGTLGPSPAEHGSDGLRPEPFLPRGWSQRLDQDARFTPDLGKGKGVAPRVETGEELPQSRAIAWADYVAAHEHHEVVTAVHVPSRHGATPPGVVDARRRLLGAITGLNRWGITNPEALLAGYYATLARPQDDPLADREPQVPSQTQAPAPAPKDASLSDQITAILMGEDHPAVAGPVGRP